jgi:hypothetical protein
MYEQEADAVARQVVDEIHSSPFREQNTQSPDERKPDTGEAGRVQRQITVRASGDAGGELSSEWEGELQRAKSGGQPLSPSVKEPMERAFGADFGGVRVHTGTQADRLARSIQAKAFTTGQNVFFRQGAYEPGSRGGQETIAHELTHVVQQKGEGKGIGVIRRNLLKEGVQLFGEEIIKEKVQGTKGGQFDIAVTGIGLMSTYGGEMPNVMSTGGKLLFKPTQWIGDVHLGGAQIAIRYGMEGLDISPKIRLIVDNTISAVGAFLVNPIFGAFMLPLYIFNIALGIYEINYQEELYWQKLLDEAKAKVMKKIEKKKLTIMLREEEIMKKQMEREWNDGEKVTKVTYRNPTSRELMPEREIKNYEWVRVMEYTNEQKLTANQVRWVAYYHNKIVNEWWDTNERYDKTLTQKPPQKLAKEVEKIEDARKNLFENARKWA